MATPVLSAGIVVTDRLPAPRRYLLLRAYRNWGFPKGLVEAGETPFAAAQRETREETGLASLTFPCGEVYQETPPYSGGKIARYYLGVASTTAVTLPVNPALGRPEHHAFRWVTYEEGRRLLTPRLQAILGWAHATMDGAAVS
jgi:bis(5'-nucleosidyl)-tetraphosphatase